MKKRIVIITDCIDVAANEIRATLISELYKLGKVNKINIEPIVKAKEFSIINGAFLVRLMAEIYPSQNTVFLVILNALNSNRKQRARIIGETINGFKFVGANTGTLGWLIKDFGIKQIYESSKRGLSGKEFISFGGKYIHTPIAARVVSGEKLKELGVRKLESNFLTYPDLKEGTIVHIDNFGVIKIFGNLLSGLKEGDKTRIFVNGEEKCIATFTHSMKALSDGVWVIYPGSSLNNIPEIGRVRKIDAAEKLGVKIGDTITIKKY